MYHYAKDYEKAVFHGTRQTEISPVNHISWGRLGESTRMIAGRDEEARSIFHKAVELVQADLEINVNNWENHGFLAVYLGYLGEFQRAQQALDEMFRLNPGEEMMTHYWAALVKWEQGDVEGTFSSLDQALADGFDRQKRFIGDEPALEPIWDKYPDRMHDLLNRH